MNNQFHFKSVICIFLMVFLSSDFKGYLSFYNVKSIYFSI